jgi:hypothetical protein
VQPWQVLAGLRLQIYHEMLADPQVLRANQWSHSVELLRAAARSGCRRSGWWTIRPRWRK